MTLSETVTSSDETTDQGFWPLVRRRRVLALLNSYREQLTALTRQVESAESDVAYWKPLSEEYLAAELAALEENKTLQSQVKDRDDRITELEAKLAALNPPRKRQGKKQDAAPVVGSEVQA